MSRSKTYVLAVSVLIGLVLVAANCTPSKGDPTMDSNRGSAIDSERALHNADTVTLSEDLPMYPGAEVTHNYADDKVVGAGGFTLKIPAPVDEVERVYRELLLKNGWVLTMRTGSDDGFDVDLEFVWSNSLDGVPARRHLFLIIARHSTGGSAIYGDYERWPDANKVPLYQDAQQVEVSWAEQESVHPQRVTTYTTKATRGQVEAFYKDVMIQHGWGLATHAPPQAIAFNYWRGSTDGGGPSSYVSISAQTGPEGQTKVEIRAKGSEVEP